MEMLKLKISVIVFHNYTTIMFILDRLRIHRNSCSAFFVFVWKQRKNERERESEKKRKIMFIFCLSVALFCFLISTAWFWLLCKRCCFNTIFIFHCWTYSLLFSHHSQREMIKQNQKTKNYKNCHVFAYIMAIQQQAKNNSVIQSTLTLLFS